MSGRAIRKILAGGRGWRYAVNQLVDADAPASDDDRCAWLMQALRLVTRPQQHPGNFRYARRHHVMTTRSAIVYLILGRAGGSSEAR